MTFLALTRAVPRSMDTCELTHLDREPLDVMVARAQHAAYEDALRSIGVRVERMQELPDAPDSVFVEDTAIVLDELAIITRPGAESRRAEVETSATALARYRTIARITAPATIDGGDVLRVGKRIFVGISTRTNEAAAEQLRSFVTPHGYEVVPVSVGGVLHLKSAVTQIAPSSLVINRALIDARTFDGYTLIDIHPDEASAANALMIGDTVLFPAGFPHTQKKLEASGINLLLVGASELAKAEGALTCCSLIV